MSTEIRTGLPAKNIVRDYFKHTVHPTSGPFLQWLELKGYAIVPIKGDARPARRGTEAGPLLGKSHTATLVGGQ